MKRKVRGSLVLFLAVIAGACVAEPRRSSDDDDGGPSGNCGCEMPFNGALIDIACGEEACLGSQAFACLGDGEIQPAGGCQQGAGGSTSNTTTTTTGGGECAPLGESCSQLDCCWDPDTVIACDSNFGNPLCCIMPGASCIGGNGEFLPCCSPGGSAHACTGNGICEAGF